MSLSNICRTINLKLHHGKNNKYPVKLLISKLKLEFENPIIIKSAKISSLPWSYIISCKSNGTANDTLENDYFILTFYYSPKSSKIYHDIAELKLSIDYDCAQEAEFSKATDVCQAINQYLLAAPLESEKPYLLLVNPQSGIRKGMKIFNNCISKLLDNCRIKYELLMTERSLHAKSFIKCCESLDKYKGIIVVSGDGLIYEVFCGIMDRDSWNTDIESIPVFVIPAGSGNGLAASIAAFSGANPKDNIILFNTLLLKNPLIQPLDLMKVQSSAGLKCPSFLTLTWGLMAHVDVGSDKFRWMGTARFSIIAAVQVAKMNKYKGKLWYLPDYAKGDRNEEIKENISFANSSFRYLPDISQPIQEDDKWILLDQRFITVIVSLLPFLATDAKIAPQAKFNDGKIHIIIINPEISRSELMNSISKLETGGHFSSKAISYIECVAFRLVPECDKCYMAVDGECIVNSAIQAEIMPSIAKTITGPYVEGDFILR